MFLGLVTHKQIPRVGVPHVGHRLHAPQEKASFCELLLDSLIVGCSVRVGFLVRMCLCFSYPSQCTLFIFCCGRSVQLVFRNFSEGIAAHRAVDLLCLWEEASSGSSEAAILNHSLSGSLNGKIETKKEDMNY